VKEKGRVWGTCKKEVKKWPVPRTRGDVQPGLGGARSKDLSPNMGGRTGELRGAGNRECITGSAKAKEWLKDPIILC